MVLLQAAILRKESGAYHYPPELNKSHVSWSLLINNFLTISATLPKE